MSRQKKETMRQMLICFVLPITIAYTIRLIGVFYHPNSVLLPFARSLIYIVMFVAFAISVYRRIIQVEVRKYMLAVSALMLLWIIARTVKYVLPIYAEQQDYSIMEIQCIRHWMWYLYYLPMIFIPPLTMYVSLSVCRGENYRVPWKVKLLYIPASILLLLVLTNDLHQLVFLFPEGSPPYEVDKYSYGIGYYAVACWMTICFISAVVYVFLQNRMPDKKFRIVIPVGILVSLLIYNILNALNLPFVRHWIPDFSVINCLCLVAFFESLFRLNLIQTNSRYRELFRDSNTGAVILDNEYRIITAASNYKPLPDAVLRTAADAPVMLENNIRLSSAQIKGGRVFWTEDVSELTEVLDELADKNEFLTEREKALSKEVETKQRKHRLRERNRLFNELTFHTKSETDRYSQLVDELEHTTDKEYTKTLLAKLSVVCTHIKRRGNLIFLADNTDLIDLSELEHAVNEWLSGLRLRGVLCKAIYDLEGCAELEDLLSVYEAISNILYALTDSLNSLMVRAFVKDGKPQLLISASCSRDIEKIVIPDVYVCDEGNREWVFRVFAGDGGEAL